MRRRVYDCVLFNGEFEVLALRIRELNDIVDQFVVVESDRTFSGLKKPVTFSMEHDSIKEFSNKLRFVLVDDMPETNNAWDREVWQRNAVMRGLEDASENDLILMSDADEIPRAESVKAALADEHFAAFGFRMNIYYFYMNYKNTKGHPHIVWTVGAQMGLLKTYTPDALRYKIRQGEVEARIFDNGGWHFSYLMDEDAIRKKIKSFSHQEFNRKQFLGSINIQDIVLNSKDLFGRKDYEWSIVEESDLPRYIIEHRAEFQRYFYTPGSPDNAATPSDHTDPGTRLQLLGRSVQKYIRKALRI